jgi:hypothetical protein
MLSNTGSLDNAMKSIRHQIRRHTPALALLTGSLCLLSPLLFPLLFSAEFAESAIIFNVYLLLILSRLNLSHTVMMQTESYDVMNIVATAEVILNVFLSIWWVQYMGWVGIALATIVAYLFEKVCFSIWLYFKKGISIQSYLPLKQYLGYSAFVVFCFVLGSFYLYN